MKCTDHGVLFVLDNSLISDYNPWVLFVLDNSLISDYNPWYEIGLRRWKDAVIPGNGNTEI